MKSRRSTPYQRIVLEQLARSGKVTSRHHDGDYFMRPDGVWTKIHPTAFTTMITERWVEETPFALFKHSYAITRSGRAVIGADRQMLTAPTAPGGPGEEGQR